MTKEKRAKQDEAITQAVSKEELTAVESQTTDLSPLIQADNTRSAVFMNPELFNSLAQISENIHDSRRTSRYYDFEEKKDEFINQQMFDRYLWEDNVKREQDDILFKAKLAYTTELKQRMEQAERSEDASTVTQTVKDVSDKYDKLYNKLSGVSPYIADNFEKYKQEKTITEHSNAIATDHRIAEDRAKFNEQNAANIACKDMSNAKNIKEASIQETFKTYARLAFPQFDVFTNIEGRNRARITYNQIAKAKITKLNEDLALGNISPQDHRKALLDIRTQDWEATVTGPRYGADSEKQEDITFKVTLDETTDDLISRSLLSAGNKQNNSASVHAYESYTGAVDFDKLKEGDIANSTYCRNYDLADANKQYDIAMSNLALTGALETTTGRDQAYKLTNAHFGTTYPTVGVSDYVKVQMAKKGNVNGVSRDLDIMAAHIEANFDFYKKGGRSNFLIIPGDKDGTVYIDLHAPKIDDKTYPFYVRPGEDLEQKNAAFYMKMINTLRMLSKKIPTTDSVAGTNAELTKRQDTFIASMHPSSLVITDKAVGRTYINDAAVNDAIRAGKEHHDYQSATVKGWVKPSLVSVIKKHKEAYKAMSPQERSIALQAQARVESALGQDDALINADEFQYDKDELELIQEAQTYLLLEHMPGGKEYAEKIASNYSSGIYQKVDPEFAKQSFVNAKNAQAKLSKDYYANTEAIMNRYDVPAKYRPLLRNTFAQMILTKWDPTKQELKDVEVDYNIFDNLVGSNFEHGTYKHSAIFKNENLAATLNYESLKETEKQLNADIKRTLGSKSEARVRVNTDTGNLDVYPINSNNPMDLEGYFKGLFGSSTYPLSISLVKPEGVSDKAYKEGSSDIIRLMSIAGNLLSVKSSSEDADVTTGNRQIDAYIEKHNTSLRQMQVESLRLLNTLKDPDAQEEYLQHIQTGFKNFSGPSAPKNVVDLMSTMMGVDLQQVLNSGDVEAYLSLRRKIDWLYARESNGSKLNLSVPKSLVEEGEGLPSQELTMEIGSIRNPQTGSIEFRVTSTVGGAHYTGAHGTEKEGKGKAVDVAFGSSPGSRELFDRTGSNAGKLNVNSLKRFIEKIQPYIDNGSLEKIVTGFDYLVAGRSNDPAYEFIRNLKNKKGEPLFRIIQPELAEKSPHKDHFHLQFYEAIVTKDGVKYDPVADLTEANNIADRSEKPEIKSAFYSSKFGADIGDVIEHNINSSGRYFISKKDSRASIMTGGYNYRATEWDAKMTGRSVKELNANALTKSMAYANRFAVFTSVFGDRKTALYALAGADFIVEDVNTGERTKYSGEQIVDMTMDGKIETFMSKEARENTVREKDWKKAKDKYSPILLRYGQTPPRMIPSSLNAKTIYTAPVSKDKQKEYDRFIQKFEGAGW